MQNYRIVTDSNSDMVAGYAEANGIIEMQLTYTMDDKTYFCNDPTYTRAEFYAQMRAGKLPITAQINPEDAVREMRPLLTAGEDLLCVMFSSGLSGTYNSARLAAEELQPEFPERTIIVIDTLGASAGVGLLVSRALANREAGMGIAENAAELTGQITHLAGVFTVDDLGHLRRGGRISAATAMVGTMLGIKPLMHVNSEGKLVPIGKVRGRRASLLGLVDEMGKRFDKARCDCFAISHGDCADDAQFVADEICKRFGLKDYSISYVGPTIGAHSGPGTVALFFLGKER